MKVRDFLLELCSFCIMRLCFIDIKNHKRVYLPIEKYLNEDVIRFFTVDDVLYLVINH